MFDLVVGSVVDPGGVSCVGPGVRERRPGMRYGAVTWGDEQTGWQVSLELHWGSVRGLSRVRLT